MSRRIPGEKPGLLIHYTVDGELQSTTVETLTPREILSNADIDPDTHYLIRVDGRDGESYRDNPDQPIHIDEHVAFKAVEKRS